MTSHVKTLFIIALLGFVVVPSSVAATLTIDISSTDSWDNLGSANNDVLTIDLAAELGFTSGTSLTVTGIGWDVVIEALGFSWLSEMTTEFRSTDNSDFLAVSPGAGNDFPGGPMAFTSGGVLNLASIDPAFPIDLSDGVLVIEFFETFDDVTGAPDGQWLDGTFTVEAIAAAPIPIPAALPLLLCALGCVGLLGRKATG